MFFIVISRIKDKVMLLMRIIIILCILLLLSVQLYSVIRKGDTPAKQIPLVKSNERRTPAPLVNPGFFITCRGKIPGNVEIKSKAGG